MEGMGNGNPMLSMELPPSNRFATPPYLDGRLLRSNCLPAFSSQCPPSKHRWGEINSYLCLGTIRLPNHWVLFNPTIAVPDQKQNLQPAQIRNKTYFPSLAVPDQGPTYVENHFSTQGVLFYFFFLSRNSACLSPWVEWFKAQSVVFYCYCWNNTS